MATCRYPLAISSVQNDVNSSFSWEKLRIFLHIFNVAIFVEDVNSWMRCIHEFFKNCAVTKSNESTVILLCLLTANRLNRPTLHVRVLFKVATAGFYNSVNMRGADASPYCQTSILVFLAFPIKEVVAKQRDYFLTWKGTLNIRIA